MSLNNKFWMIVLAFIALVGPMHVSLALTLEEALAAVPAKTPAEAEQFYGTLVADSSLLNAVILKQLSYYEPLTETEMAAIGNVEAEKAPSGAALDEQVKLLLGGAANHVMKPGREAVRTSAARAFDGALQRATAPVMQRFFMSLLRVCGDDASLPVLGAYLCHPELCQDAVITVSAIGGPAATALLKATSCDAVPLANEAIASALVQLGEAMPADATGAGIDPDIIRALDAPGQVGDAGALAGKCRAVLASNSVPAQDKALALRALVETVGVDAQQDVIQAARQEAPVLWGAALQLAAKIPGGEASRAWKNAFSEFPETVRPSVIYMLGQRDDDVARKAVRSATADENKLIRLAAYDVITRWGIPEADAASAYKECECPVANRSRELDGKTLTALTRAMQHAEDAVEIQAVKQAMLRLPDPAVSDNAIKRLGRSAPMQQAALLDIVAAKQAEQHIQTVLEYVKNQDANVRRAAMNALAVMGRASDMPLLFDSLLSESGDPEIAAAREAVVAIAKRTGAQQNALEQMDALLANANLESLTRLVKCLSALGGGAALDRMNALAEKALLKETKDADAAKVVLDALAVWPDPAVCDVLLGLMERLENPDDRLAVLKQTAIAAQRANSELPAQLDALRKAKEFCRSDAETALISDAMDKVRRAAKR